MTNSIPIETQGGKTTINVSGNFNGGRAVVEYLTVNRHPLDERHWSQIPPDQGKAVFTEPATRTFDLWTLNAATAHRLRLVDGAANPTLTVTVT
jgi:hypothetical protein